MSGKTAILIGSPETCALLERQLDLLGDARPVTLGWILAPRSDATSHAHQPILGSIDQMEAILARRLPGVALVSMPAAMKDLIQSIRTRLRRAQVPDRFIPTMHDLLAGVGPRSEFAIDPAMLLNRQPREVDRDLLATLLRGKRIMITGAGGSIGSELCRRAAEFEPEGLFLVERSENALFEIDRQIARFQPRMSRRAILHDIVDTDATRKLMEELRPHVIFHSAAHKHVPMMEDHPSAAIDNNLFGTKSVADAADAAGVERFVMISTDKAVNPTSIMGATKRLAEMYIQQLHARSRTAFSMVRFGNVLGSSGSVIEIWSRQLVDGGPLTVTDPRMTRYFMTIGEAAALVMQAAAIADVDSPVADVFMLNMGEPVNIMNMAERFAHLHGLEPIVEKRDATDIKDSAAAMIGIVFTGIRPGEKLREQLARDVDHLRPTRHPDIDIWELPEVDPQDVERLMEALSPIARGRTASEVSIKIRSLVPDMLPGNLDCPTSEPHWLAA